MVTTLERVSSVVCSHTPVCRAILTYHIRMARKMKARQAEIGCEREREGIQKAD